jgi:hypothetical protein
MQSIAGGVLIVFDDAHPAVAFHMGNLHSGNVFYAVQAKASLPFVLCKNFLFQVFGDCPSSGFLGQQAA